MMDNENETVTGYVVRLEMENGEKQEFDVRADSMTAAVAEAQTEADGEVVDSEILAEVEAEVVDDPPEWMEEMDGC